MTAAFLLSHPPIKLQDSCELFLLAVTGFCPAARFPAAQITILFTFPFCRFLTGGILMNQIILPLLK